MEREFPIKKFLFLPLALTVLTCAEAYAQNETSAASHSSKLAAVNDTAPDGSNDVSINIGTSFKQIFAISEEQESALNANHSVNITTLDGPMDFQFSDDPKWVPGAKSVSIKEVDTSGSFAASKSIKAKWGRGKFTISGKASVIFGGSSSSRVPGHPNATVRVGTKFSGPSTFEAVTYVSVERKEALTETIKADGTQSENTRVSVKSKSLVDAPLPK